MSDNDYGHGLRDVMELQRQSDELQEITREHLKRSLMTEHERRSLEDPPLPEQKGEQQ